MTIAEFTSTLSPLARKGRAIRSTTGPSSSRLLAGRLLDPDLQTAFIARLEDKHKGGVIGVGPMGLA